MVAKKKIIKQPLFQKCDSIDKEMKTFMKKNNLKMFRSSKDRITDRKIALNKYGKKFIQENDLIIHHSLSGLVGLVPKEIHKFRHNGYFKRLALS